jgi:hypothetical protein
MQTQLLPRDVWESYTESWRVASVAEKRRLYETCLSPACIYTDPTTVAAGWDQLEAYMVGFHAQVPGGHFVTDVFFAHHGCSIARWRMLGADGAQLGEGTSYGEYDAEGKLVVMTGFFAVPGASAS